MKYFSLLLLLFITNSTLANCIADLDKYWEENNPNKGTAYSGPSVQDFKDINNDGIKEKIVVMGGGKLGQGTVYIKDSKGCYIIIYEGSAEVTITDYIDPKGKTLKTFNNFVFLSDRTVGGCAGGNRSNSIYAYGKGKYNLIKRTELRCLEHLKSY